MRDFSAELRSAPLVAAPARPDTAVEEDAAHEEVFESGKVSTDEASVVVVAFCGLGAAGALANCGACLAAVAETACNNCTKSASEMEPPDDMGGVLERTGRQRERSALQLEAWNCRSRST